MGDAQKNLRMESHMRHRVSSSSMSPIHGLCTHLQIKTEERGWMDQQQGSKV